MCTTLSKSNFHIDKFARLFICPIDYEELTYFLLQVDSNLCTTTTMGTPKNCGLNPGLNFKTSMYENEMKKYLIVSIFTQINIIQKVLIRFVITFR